MMEVRIVFSRSAFSFAYNKTGISGTGNLLRLIIRDGSHLVAIV